MHGARRALLPDDVSSTVPAGVKAASFGQDKAMPWKRAIVRADEI